MIDLHEARKIAEKEIERLIALDPGLAPSEVENARLEDQTESTWIFFADIPKLIEEGWVPGAVIVLVDKARGHILTEKEQAEFYKTREKNRRRAGFIK